jgi:hypothetical protein
MRLLRSTVGSGTNSADGVASLPPRPLVSSGQYSWGVVMDHLLLNYKNRWRKYRYFYSDVMNGLDFVCFTKLALGQKLYDLLGAAGPRALAG